MYQPRGKVLGGTSSINGMVYMRGNAADYDEWRQRGCEGWDYDSVLPYFRKAEDNVRGGDEFHGTGGPLKVSDHAWQPTLAKAMHDAAVEAGIPANPDFNGANQEGVGYYQTTINRSRRWSSARAYLAGAKQRKNLTIATSAHATRLLIENGRCVGVEYRTPGGLVQARAKREVIVSGGVYGSPQLLMLSGLGPAEHLKQHGIAGGARHAGRRQPPARPFQHLRRLQVLAAGDDERPRQQPAAAHPGGGAVRLRPHRPAGQHGPLCRRDGAQRQAARAARPADQHVRLGDQASGPQRRRAAALLGLRPQPGASAARRPRHGAAEVARSAGGAGDPLQLPEERQRLQRADPGHAHLPRDRQAAGAEAVRRRGDPARRRRSPSEADLKADIRARGVSNLHPVGTCRMGREVDAVVDPQLRVYGIERPARRRRLDHAVDRRPATPTPPRS